MIGLDRYRRKDTFDLRGWLIDLIAGGPDANDYAEYLDYLRLKQRGLRKQSMVAADLFVARYANDKFEVRHRICWSLIERTECHWEHWPFPPNWLFPYSLERGLLDPMFEDWRLREPANVNAWLFSTASDAGRYGDRAFELEPDNPRCQLVKLHRLKGWIAMSVHELDYLGYVLDPPEEFSQAVKALTVVTRAMGDNLSEDAQSTLDWLHALAEVHAEIRSDLRPELARRGIVEPEVPFPLTPSWFRNPPVIWRN
jgi:hypothetical protein